MPGAKIFEVEKNSFTTSLISVLLVNAILGGCGPAPQGGGTPKMRLPLSIMTKTKSMDQVWGPNSTTPFHSLFDFLVPPLLNKLVFCQAPPNEDQAKFCKFQTDCDEDIFAEDDLDLVDSFPELKVASGVHLKGIYL